MKLPNEIHIGFTGSRIGLSKCQAEILYSTLKDVTFGCNNNQTIFLHHGDCIGADEEVYNIAQLLNIKTICHPPISKSLRAYTKNNYFYYSEKEYLERNKDIVNCSDYLIAMPNNENKLLLDYNKSRGTWHTINFAKKRKLKTTITFLDGSQILYSF